MPWSASNTSGLPKNVRGLSDKRRRQWADVANAALKRGLPDGQAIRMANGVLKKQLGHSTGKAGSKSMAEGKVVAGEKQYWGPGQLDQDEANYDPYGASGGAGCASCRWFISPDGCVIVRGAIAPTGKSDRYEADSESDDLGDIAEVGMASLPEPEQKPGFVERILEAIGMKVGEKDFTADERKKMAVSGAAMEDGSYPIPNVTYLEKAVHAIGRGNAPHESIKKHIIKRARALGAIGTLPESWGVKELVPAFSLKETPEGRLRFLTMATNNYTDRVDETFPGESHMEYIAWAEKENGYPELWPWHMAGGRLGVVDWMDFDGNFLLSSGLIDIGMEAKAKAWADDPETGMSHGFFKRQQGNDIVQYREFEQSVLPRWAAANPFTDFTVGVKEMALTPQKRTALAEKGYSEEEIAGLEAYTDNFRKKLAEAGVAFKDLDEGTEPAPAPEPEPNPEPEPGEPAPTPGFDLAGLRVVIREEIAAANKDLADKVGTIEASVKGLQTDEDAKFSQLWEARRGAPPASRQPTFAGTKETPTNPDAKVAWVNDVPLFQHPIFQLGQNGTPNAGS